MKSTEKKQQANNLYTRELHIAFVTNSNLSQVFTCMIPMIASIFNAHEI